MTKLTRTEIVARILDIRDKVPDDTEPRWALLALADAINDPTGQTATARSSDLGQHGGQVFGLGATVIPPYVEPPIGDTSGDAEAVRRGRMTPNRARERAGFQPVTRTQPSYADVRFRLYNLADEYPRSEMELRKDIAALAMEMATPIRGPYDLPTSDPTPFDRARDLLRAGRTDSMTTQTPEVVPEMVTLKGGGSLNLMSEPRFVIGQDVMFMETDGIWTYAGPIIVRAHTAGATDWRYVVKFLAGRILRESELVPVKLVQS